ncbi:MAG: FliH/SctL family protein [Acidobacteriaceae bacterium]|jgi:flagellar assembly protein FliH
MSLPSEAQRGLPASVMNAETVGAFRGAEGPVSPFEFRSIACADVVAMEPLDGAAGGRGDRVRVCRDAMADRERRGPGREFGDASMRDPAEAARQEGMLAGMQEGRRVARAEMDAELQASMAREREKVASAVKEFSAARERYFASVEQEIVKLALAIAARVLHREAQSDPLLLSGVVRVALDKMADRSGVVMRVRPADVVAWERVFAATEPAERPRVVEDARLELGECRLETKMGTIELGVSVQLEEIEKGFCDLLQHRPVQ